MRRPSGRAPGTAPARSPSGLTLIVGATVIAGIVGYVITWWIPATIGGVRYAVFAVFWSSLYLVIGGLSGIQQEVTRASRPITPGVTPTSRTRDFGLLLAVVTVVLGLASAPLWVDRVFPEEGFSLVFPLVVGMAGYVLVATVAGALYGVASWTAVALLIVVDSLLRLVAVGVTLLATGEVVALAWAAALPFGATLALVWPAIRRSIVGRTELDVGYRALTWNVARTLLASFSSAAIISGFPLLLSVSSPDESPRVLATLFLSTLLVRAPLIVSVLALQGYLLVRFRSAGEGWGRMLRRILGGIALAAGVLAAAAWALGPPIFSFLFPDELVVSREFFAILVTSSALIGALSVAAPAVLARDDHLTYSLGWLAAAVVTVASLAIPLDLFARVSLALIAGPGAGLLVHAVTALVSRSRSRRSVS